MIEFVGEVGAWFVDADNWTGSTGALARIWEHVWYSVFFGVLAAAIALPIGLTVGHTGRGGLLVMNLANVGRAVPTFGVILIVGFYVFGLPAVTTALVALSVPPMLTNAYAGIRSVDPEIREAAEGMGMTGWQILWRVELPVAMPLVMAGVRTSMVQLVATVTLAAWGGLGGLGWILRIGLSVGDFTRVFAAALLIALLALLTEFLLSRLQRVVTAKGVAQREADIAAAKMQKAPA